MAEDRPHLRFRDVQDLPQSFTTSLDPKDILTVLVGHTSEVLGATRCSLVRVDAARHPGKAFVFTAADDPSIEGYELSLEQYPEIQVALGQSLPIVVRDEPDDPVAERIRRVQRKVPFPLSILLPLVYRDENFGVLFLRFRSPDHPVRKEDVELCQLMTFAAAVALHNAREHEDLLADVREREHRARMLEEAHALRMEMMFSASHDLRAPLNSIIGYTDLLLDGSYGTMSVEQREILENVADNTGTLVQIINSLVDYARLEHGRIPVQASEGEVARLLEELRIVMEPIARRRNLELQLSSAPGLPKLETDWAKLQRILLNLLHNAMKFTDEGTVSLVVERADNRILFRVRDTGQGIAAAEHPHIFERFYRVNPSREEGPGGLGLAIVRRFSEMLGGEVGVESEPGKGALFTVFLPLQWRSTARP